MKQLLATSLVLLACAGALAAPPPLDIPAEVKAAPGDWVVVSPTTTAKSVVYVGLDGLKAFPSSELKDPRKLVVQAPTTAGRWRFVAVGTLGDEQTTTTFTVVVGDAPLPPIPPGPTPPVPPVPPVPPAPIPDAGLHVLVVYDKKLDSLTQEHRNVIGSTSTNGCRWYLTMKCARVADKADWAFWPDGSDASLYPSDPLRKMYARARRSLPWAVISKDGKEGYEGPLPATEAECLTLFKRYGG